ncbi:uncharacterized protein ARMOST_17529 [Armillaria ostoyae]|uniref:Hsp70 protein n=1 Tax=Armillaria ostoyae TaxID=47428 RepID=A0A284RZ82_ARMOS|nr:uncharacterized protein ARMOST_17529 [Armillaria ostoyae]
MAATRREQCSDSPRKLVIAFDLGTINSSASYSIVLAPGTVPDIKIARFLPCGDAVAEYFRVPTIIYYDLQGKVAAVGTQTLDQATICNAKEKGWVKYSQFKLHLCPVGMTSLNASLPPLPAGKTVLQLFSDFYAYLFEGTKNFILRDDPSGETVWSTIKDNIEFVLSHPNGWEEEQRNQMRQAMINAQLIYDNDKGHSQITFITEGQSSLHFSIQHGLLSHIKKDEAVLIINAGGGTVDISTYGSVALATTSGARSLGEIATPRCLLAGSVFVTHEARNFIANKLRRSKFAVEVDKIAECFDRTIKLAFGGLVGRDMHVDFGSDSDKSSKLGIDSGRLKLSRIDITNFFEPSVMSIIEAVKSERRTCNKPNLIVVLCGGFAVSVWLCKRLRGELEALGIALSCPKDHTSTGSGAFKGIMNMNTHTVYGSMSFYLNPIVTSRISNSTYGMQVNRKYNPDDPEDRKRERFMYTDTSGTVRLGNQFEVILPKNTVVFEDTEFRLSSKRIEKHWKHLTSISHDVICYRGSEECPRWMPQQMDTERNDYDVLCRLKADTKCAAEHLLPQKTSSGKTFYVLEYDVVLVFGEMGLKAQFCWKENGIERRNEPRVVHD